MWRNEKHFVLPIQPKMSYLTFCNWRCSTLLKLVANADKFLNTKQHGDFYLGGNQGTT
jgi:hypothetical protein